MEVSKSSSPSLSPPSQAAPQTRTANEAQARRRAGGWNLPDEITLRILDFAAADPMARSRLRGVNTWFDSLVDDNSFWRTCMPLADANLARPPEQARALAAVPPQPLAGGLVAPFQGPLSQTPRQRPNAAREFRTAVNGLPGHAELPGLSPSERDALKALLTHAPGATELAQARIDQNEALERNAAFMAAALQHDHVFLRCEFHKLAADYGSAQFKSLQAGLVHQAAGRLEAAEAALRTSVGKDPRLLTSRYMLGCTLREQGKRAAALAVFADVIARRPHYAEPHYLSGIVFEAQGDYLSALRHFETAVALKPALSAARLCQGATLLHLERYGEALAALIDYRSVDATNSMAAAGEAWARYRLDDIGQALGLCDRFLREFPQDIVVRVTRGNIYFTESPVSSEALEDFEAVLAVAPECKIAQVKRRLLRDNREALRSALEACDDAIIAGTDVDEAYFNRALLRYRYGDYNAALEDCFIAAAVRVSTKLYVLQAALCEELNHFPEAENFERLATQAGEEEYDAACAAIWPADPIVTAQNVGAGTLS